MNAEQTLRSFASDLLRRYPQSTFSSLYRSAPLLRTDQDSFLNAVVRIQTSDSLDQFHAWMIDREQYYHKAPPYRFGPRTLDLDLLLFDDIILPSRSEWQESTKSVNPDDTRFFLPHLRLHERRFVLEPLCELLSASFLHPVLGQSYHSLLLDVLDQECTKTNLSLY